ncbi:MAG: signal peptide peptidase SppA [Methanobacteriota archaeon]|nr:MAG: signal peptide peptidase SppA [Euryarchaeota archaeon]
MKTRYVGLAITTLVVLFLILAYFAAKTTVEEETLTRGKIGLIHIEGVITAGSGGDIFFGEPSGSSVRVVKLLEEARENPEILAVVIRINSPGGSAVGSQEIVDGINRLQKSGKKVLVSMGDVAASGGYYIASAADLIVAERSTITGSIGVIHSHLDLSKLLEKLGIRVEVLTTGEFKDTGIFTRPYTEEERKIIQEMLEDIHNQFVEAVAKGRNMDKEKVMELADGRIFTGRKAKELGLVDELGSLEYTIRRAGEMVGIKGRPEVVHLGKPSLFELFFGATAKKVGEGIGEALVRSVKQETELQPFTARVPSRDNS